ncbi:MAG: universal stress protein [Acidimicrobiia bacterium]|nr:universal stress protein [Acidimicrobiia bacterium]
MTRILAVVDDSDTAPAVLATANALAEAVRATVEAIHVREDGTELIEEEARRAGMPLRVLGGDVVGEIVAASAAADIRTVVIGGRRRPDPLRPTGHIAFALLTRMTTSLVVVPPTAGTEIQLRRMLVPLDGTVATADRARTAIDLAEVAGIETIVVHVCDEDRVPMFTDQPHHETRAFADEFIERYVPRAEVSLELRVGPPADEVLIAADALDVDLIAIVWGQILDPGHAQVVKELLARSHVPLLFLPLESPSPT